jgi:uncharacterized protein (TIGR00661 family)
LHHLAPKPQNDDLMGKLILQNYAPTNYNYGLHFKSLDTNVFTPIIRKEVRAITPTNNGHYTVYLPSYDDIQIIKKLKKIEQVEWHVFSKHSSKKYKVHNISINPINSELFLKSMASAEGIFTNAGFGTTSEALFLKKKLLVIPMKKQYEQHCNAAMLEEMGVTVLKKFNKKMIEPILEWVNSTNLVEVDYKDNVKDIIDLIIKNHNVLIKDGQIDK